MHLNLAEKLRQLRREAGITQEQLAAMLQVSPQAVSKWERDGAYPDITFLPALANYYGVTTDFLLGNDDLTRQQEIDAYYNAREQYTEEEDYRHLLALCQKYPDDADLGLDLVWAIVRREERVREHYSLLNAIAQRLVQTDAATRFQIAEAMCRVCPREELEGWLTIFPETPLGRSDILEKRLDHQGKTRESRQLRQVNRFARTISFLTQLDTDTSDQLNTALGILRQLMAGLPEQNGWLGQYAYTHQKLADCLFSQGQKEEAYTALEKALALFARWSAIPPGTLLEVGNPHLFGGLKVIKHNFIIRLALEDGSQRECGLLQVMNNCPPAAMDNNPHWAGFYAVRGEKRYQSLLEQAGKIAGTS